MQRPVRLQAAVKWRAGYGGKNIVRGYARWFGVDLVCAIVELRLLGVAVAEEYERQIRCAMAARAAARARRRAERLAAPTAPLELDESLDGPVEWLWDDDLATMPNDDIPF